jgi:Rhodopirellula transposase DDE domain
MTPYSPDIEQTMKAYYDTLTEKEQRRYAGVEAIKFGRGGVAYIIRVLGCSRKTVVKGIKEVKRLTPGSKRDKRVRKAGGGRKRYDETYPEIDEKFLEVLKYDTAGDPMDETVRWTNLRPWEIVQRLAARYGINVSRTVVRKLLTKHNYRRRKALKQETMKNVPHRNEQFENIARKIAEYEAKGHPIISMDTKKKEQLGNFYRDGQLYTLEQLLTFDHDFSSFGQGVVIPHGLYDLKQNIGYINLGNSKDTGQFACDCLRNWWYNRGQYDYPDATSILILCDGGGSNSSRHYIFKQDLQQLVDELGIEIRIAHYPPYTSKYNPIEHRLFPHVTRACQGVIFTSIELVKELIEKTRTSTGLKVTVQIIDKVYETGRKVADSFKETMRLVFDDYLPQWNYTAVPNREVI